MSAASVGVVGGRVTSELGNGPEHDAQNEEKSAHDGDEDEWLWHAAMVRVARPRNKAPMVLTAGTTARGRRRDTGASASRLNHLAAEALDGVRVDRIG